MDGLINVSIFFACLGFFFMGISFLYAVSVWSKKQ